MTNETQTIIHALQKAVEALKTLSEKDFATADRKAYALRVFHEINQPEYFDPAYGDFFCWADDGDYSGTDIESVCDAIEIEPYHLVQLQRSITLSDVFVVAIPGTDDSLEYEVFSTEAEAEDRANAAEEAHPA